MSQNQHKVFPPGPPGFQWHEGECGVGFGHMVQSQCEQQRHREC